MFDHVYSDAHPVAHAQKAWLRDYLDSFEDAAE